MMTSKHYVRTVDQTFEEFHSSPHGLSDAQIIKARKEYGFNELTEKPSTSIFKLILEQFTSPLVIILIIAGGVSMFLKEPKDAIVIFAIIIINAIIGFVQEIQAARSIDSLKTMIKLQAQVLRSGKEQEIESRELVPGDIVILQAGDKIPADLRLIELHEAQFEEAILTGESVPVSKVTKHITGENLSYADQTNIGFGGTLLVKGSARGIVIATGDNTAIGQISQTIEEVKEEELPVQIKIAQFAKKIGLITAGGSVLVFIVGLLAGLPIGQIFRDMVAVLVAAVPEGLPIVVTVTLAIGVQRMARSKAIVRHLPAVETLGSTTVIGTDKTGTLTKNQMTVRQIFADSKLFDVTGEGYDVSGRIELEGAPQSCDKESDFYWALVTGVLCNESRIKVVDGEATILGDPTEGALHVSGLKAGLDAERLLKEYPLLDQIPFDSERYYMATLHQYKEKQLILVKGSPDVIVHYCVGADTEKILAEVEKLSREGLRVLAMIKKEVSHSKHIEPSDITSGFEFVGLQAMIDPPRKEVADTIGQCQAAGIRVVMITGDHAITATAIGKQVHIIQDDSEVITGKELQGMTAEQLDEITKRVHIYARVAPTDKLRIVESLKRNGEIVAVTGDGVNDAPALKTAHIGVAMGKGGTDVAREAADMVITDDNFVSIVKAVEQGRIVFENIRRVALYLVPTGIAAIVTVLVCMFLGLPIPYTPIQLLWINLVASGLQDIALAFEPGDGDSLKRKPLSLKEGIMNGPMLRRTFIVGAVISVGVIALYLFALRLGTSLAEARSLAMTATVFFQFFQVWNARSETKSVFQLNPFSNPFLFISMIVSLIAQIAVVYVPSLQSVFDTYALDVIQWFVIILTASSVIVAVEIDKRLAQRNEGRKLK